MTDTVSIIDDEASVRDAVGMLLETNGYAVASYSSVAAFLSAPFAPGAVVSDVRMPEATGLDLLRRMQASEDPRPIILLTGHGDIEMAVQALKLGAFDFIEKPFDLDRLLASVASAMETSVTSLKTTLEMQELKTRYASLSDRQRDTMHLLIRGLSNKEIGLELGISPRTVEIHRTWVMTRMQANSMADLVRMGLALGLA
jgi:two-component system, LuxR family, response regulator FixJ